MICLSIYYFTVSVFGSIFPMLVREILKSYPFVLRVACTAVPTAKARTPLEIEKMFFS